MVTLICRGVRATSGPLPAYVFACFSNLRLEACLERVEAFSELREYGTELLR